MAAPDTPWSQYLAKHLVEIIGTIQPLILNNRWWGVGAGGSEHWHNEVELPQCSKVKSVHIHDTAILMHSDFEMGFFYNTHAQFICGHWSRLLWSISRFLSCCQRVISTSKHLKYTCSFFEMGRQLELCARIETVHVSVHQELHIIDTASS